MGSATPFTIAPCLWFDDQAEAAAELYTDVFQDSRITAVARYPETFDNPGGKPRGSVLTVELDIAGTTFTALNGGPLFTINPTISFFVRTPDVAQAEQIAGRLGEGGSYLMELGEYPWSPHYAWLQDRFGVSWQVMAAPDEVDHFWSALSDGGEQGPCGWLKDRFGVSWQVVPTAFIDMIKDGEGAGPGYERAFQAMLGMKKLDIAALAAAYRGEEEA